MPYNSCPDAKLFAQVYYLDKVCVIQQRYRLKMTKETGVVQIKSPNWMPQDPNRSQRNVSPPHLFCLFDLEKHKSHDNTVSSSPVMTLRYRTTCTMVTGKTDLCVRNGVMTAWINKHISSLLHFYLKLFKKWTIVVLFGTC